MNFFDLVLKNGNVFLPNNKVEKIDIGIVDEKISFIGNIENSQAKSLVDLTNLNVLPGCIDTQVHFREPGLIHKEDLASGTKGAVLGGITGIFEMPNTKPPTITKDDFEVKILLAEKKSFCDFSFFIGAAKENIDKLDHLENLSGCCGVKIFMGASTGELLVEDDESLRKILSTGKRRVAIHSEDEYRLKDRKNIIEKKDVTVHDHEHWRDAKAALSSTKRLLKIAKEVGRKIHVLHISTVDEIPLLQESKAFATAEATPQHLFFHSPDCYDRLGTFAQMNPPIRGIKHKEGLWKAVKDKVIDVVGSDHAPHTISEKNNKYPNSPSGMPGVQTLVPIMLNFVNQNKISLSDFVRLTSVNPTKIYNIKNKGFIKKGYDADFTIVDLKKERTIDNNWIATKSNWTPYDGVSVTGWPVYTIIRGKVIMYNDSIINGPIGRKIEFENN